jgi:hypothetical protein
MVLLIYIPICFIWALVIREKDDFENTILAFLSSILGTPIFGKRLYYEFNGYEIDKIRKERELLARLEKERKESEALRFKLKMKSESDFLKSLSGKDIPPARKKNKNIVL